MTKFFPMPFPCGVICWGLGLTFLAGAVGCNRGPAMHQVSGHVFYKDGTVPRGGVAVVFLQPKKDSTAVLKKSASSAIQPDGSFKMYSKTAGDGVYAGQYDVGFTIIKAVMDAKPLIQEKYTRPDTSGISVDVNEDKTDLKFEIEPLPGVKGAPPSG